MKRLVVFGASGATGQLIVAAALRKHWRVTAFVRKPCDFPGAQVVVGDVSDKTAVARAIAGQDVVISALGVGKPLKPDPVVVQGVENIIDSMQANDVRRLLYMSFVGVRESRAAAGWLIRNVARHPLRHEIADHERKEALIKASGLDWTIVRPPKLTNDAGTGRYRHGEDVASRAFFPRLARADVAELMVREVETDLAIRRAIVLMPE
jgi:putative NADH-flavin reductase